MVAFWFIGLEHSLSRFVFLYNLQQFEVSMLWVHECFQQWRVCLNFRKKIELLREMSTYPGPQKIFFSGFSHTFYAP